MFDASPAIVTFLRRLVAHVAGQRAYLSFAERARFIEVVSQFDPTYNERGMSEDLLFRSVDLLRVGLADVAEEGGPMATYALVAATQIMLADNRLDTDDLALVSWIGHALGADQARIDRVVELVDGPGRLVGAAPVGVI